jgi:predicted O-methyltransferase YrrM
VELQLEALLGEIFKSGRRHDESEPEHARRFLNLELDTAHLISILVRATRRTRILEIGTSSGYSTIWLAWAAKSVGGKVTSIERDGAKQASADANLTLAHLRDVVDLRLGSATEVVAGLAGPFDMVFFDADRLSAPAQLKILVPKLSQDVLLLADNAQSHAEEIAPYLRAVKRLLGFDHMVIPVGKGLSVAYRPS